ncbi:MAG: hypothetical protein V4754_13630 [Pseudomonadota bacterium]
MVAKAERAGIPPAALQQQLEEDQSVEDVTAGVNLMSKAADAGVSPAEMHDAVIHGASAEEIDTALDKRLGSSKQSDLQSISGEPSGDNEIGSTGKTDYGSESNERYRGRPTHGSSRDSEPSQIG